MRAFANADSRHSIPIVTTMFYSFAMICSDDEATVEGCDHLFVAVSMRKLTRKLTIPVIPAPSGSRYFSIRPQKKGVVCARGRFLHIFKNQTRRTARLMIDSAELAICVVPHSPSLVVLSYEHAVVPPSSDASPFGSIAAMDVAEHM